MEHAVILAGGSGTRLWPMSRRHRPKQLLPLVAGRTLLALALERLAPLFAPERTWIITSAELAPAIRAVARTLPGENILGEPAARDTSNAIGLGCLLLARRDGQAKVGIFTADHVIGPADRFAAVVRDAFDLLDSQPDALITLGVRPTWPHTGLGYIHRGAPLAGRFHAVSRFVEKPDRPTAEQFLASGEYYWNSGMFLWRAATAIAALARFRPDHLAMLRRAADALAGGPEELSALAEIYNQLPKISIDYALMEPASISTGPGRVVVGELDCQWVDLGSWAVMPQVNPVDASGNLSLGPVATVDSAGNILVNDDPAHLLAALGVENLVVVHSGNATLVAPKARAQDLKKLLEQVRRDFGARFE